MKILVVLCRNPFSTQDGGTYAIRRSLEALSKHHKLYLTGFGSEFCSSELSGFPCCGSLGENHNSYWDFLASILQLKPYSLTKYSSSFAKRKLKEILNGSSFDIVWYEQTQAAAAAHFASLFPAAPSGPLHFLRMHNLEFRAIAERARNGNLIKRVVFGIESALLRRSEMQIARQVDRVLTISEEDLLCLREQVLQPNLPASYLPLPISTLLPELSHHKVPRKTISFVGKCSWEPNYAAAKWIVGELAPVLARIIPEARIKLAGSQTECLIPSITTQNVTCLGFIDDLRSLYSESLCTLAPIRAGSGVNIKCIESLSNAVPVVGTRLGRRGINNRAYVVAEDATSCAYHIAQLMTNPKLQAELAMNAIEDLTIQSQMFFRTLQGIFDEML